MLGGDDPRRYSASDRAVILSRHQQCLLPELLTASLPTFFLHSSRSAHQPTSTLCVVFGPRLVPCHALWPVSPTMASGLCLQPSVDELHDPSYEPKVGEENAVSQMESVASRRGEAERAKMERCVRGARWS